MNWKTFLSAIHQVEPTAGFNFELPIDEALLVQFHQTFGLTLPDQLTQLYEQTNGVQQTIIVNSKKIVIGDLIWPLEYTIRQNIEMRTHSTFANLYMPFDHLLFFADAGNGDLFAFAVLNKKIRNPDIFVWNHENDSRTWVAPSLEQFVEWRIQGKIKT